VTSSSQRIGSIVDTSQFDTRIGIDGQTAASALASAGRPPDDIGLHTRVTRLEDGFFYVRRDISDIRSDVRDTKEKVALVVRAVDKLGSDILALDAKVDHKFAVLDAKIDSKVDVLEAKLDSKIDVLEAKLDSKIDALEAKLDSKIDALEAKLDSKIDALEAKIDKKIIALDAKIDGVETTLRADIRETRVEIAALTKSLSQYPTKLQLALCAVAGVSAVLIGATALIALLLQLNGYPVAAKAVEAISGN
jgi:hypothetical protein